MRSRRLLRLESYLHRLLRCLLRYLVHRLLRCLLRLLLLFLSDGTRPIRSVSSQQ